MESAIKQITAREILDSRGNPTLEVQVVAGKASGLFSVPAGASTGSHEAVEKRDGDQDRFRGLGVLSCVSAVRMEVNKALRGMNVLDQKKIDQTLCSLAGPENKAKLGGNTTTCVSIACAKAAAAVEGDEVFEYLRTLADIPSSRHVPLLYMNLVNGGKHAKTGLAFQEYHIIPQTDDIGEALNIATAVQFALREGLVAELGAPSANFGDEGGFVPDVKSVRKPLELLTDAIRKTKYTDKVRLSLDVASSSFYKDGAYEMEGRRVPPAELTGLYRTLIKDFSLFSVEDAFFEEDFEDFASLKEGSPAVVVGDDLTVTNVARLEEAIKHKSVGAIIVKPNQVGTLTETLATMGLARKHGIECIVSHRSGETNDDFIADLAWAFGCFGLKAGAPNRGERVSKYNRLWDIQKNS